MFLSSQPFAFLASQGGLGKQPPLARQKGERLTIQYLKSYV